MVNDVFVVGALSRGWSGQSRQTVLVSDFDQGILFLKLWQAWRHNTARPARLHVIGLLPELPERHALQKTVQAKLESLGAIYLLPLLQGLLAAWPLNLPGLHRLEFESGDVTLTLGVGPDELVFGKLRARVDRFVLSDVSQLLQAGSLAADAAQAFIPAPRSDASQGGGLVQRGDEPFAVVPVSPAQSRHAAASDPWQQSPIAADGQHAVVVGAGFAGMGVAQSLAIRGWRVTVIDAHWGQPTSTHHAHAAAALTPMVSKDDNIRARLSRAGSLRAQSRWGDLPDSVLQRCGAIQLQRDQGRIVDLSAVLDALQFPAEWVECVTAERASELAGIPIGRGGIYFPTAARVNPPGLLNALAKTPGIDMLTAQAYRISNAGSLWQVSDQTGKVLVSATHVVLAGGVHTRTVLEQSGLLKENARLTQMHALGGEVSFIPSADLSGGPQCIIAGDGYVLPENEGICVVGSTYAHAALDTFVTPEGVAGNLKRAAGLLNIPELPGQMKGRKFGGWAGWRAVLPGRLPSIGPVLHAPGVWVACGFASRGLTWATLAGDLIAGALNGEPLVVENDIIEAISDN